MYAGSGVVLIGSIEGAHIASRDFAVISLLFFHVDIMGGDIVLRSLSSRH